MGTWPFVLLSLFLTVMTITGELLGEENTKPCLSWSCARKRALELSNPGESVNAARSTDAEKPCISWNCKREMLLLNKFLNAERAAEPASKRSSVIDAEDKPCLSWSCRRKRRSAVAVPQDATPESTASDMPCLTKDCRTGKRSNEGSDLMEKLRFARSNSNSENDPGCLAWHCNGRKR
ncbi:hypothetical protein OS493_012415 [Desmophyllum pertusum]|uniref:Secreted protein n=1 Tax=Desmophyllum pertusum TaxID=174260 RepID=A0A9W9ZSB3_9CNID|nr:hypothetical protein OS493_012415 [Desmophyllum pertusum]